MKVSITDIEINKVKSRKTENGTLVAIANVTFAHVFVLRGIEIKKGLEGNFIEIPNKEKLLNTLKDKDNPTAKDFLSKLNDSILEKYIESNKR